MASPQIDISSSVAPRQAPSPVTSRNTGFTEESLLRILVTGGSQGAQVLSKVVPDGLVMLPPALRQRLQVTQQCRAEDLEAVRGRYAAHDIPAELGTYFEDMHERLAGAHLFIGRAGASTIAELTAVGRPAILIPLPIATDDHQAVNTREMVKAGGARMIRQEAFQPKELAKQIQAMAMNPASLANAAHCAFNCGRPDAVKDLADLVERMSGIDLMDVIRVGEAVPVSRVRARASTSSARTEAEEQATQEQVGA
jgi:UDP-N-acetylglucosamine--N-acetylmuramyl-(pentapeptide) pyrophosphoryl-undecaprenol N-acetylglucosamine transferase